MEKVSTNGVMVVVTMGSTSMIRNMAMECILGLMEGSMQVIGSIVKDTGMARSLRLMEAKRKAFGRKIVGSSGLILRIPPVETGKIELIDQELDLSTFY